MELNTIQLSTLQSAELYASNLVVPEQARAGSFEAETVSNNNELTKHAIPFKGKNRKHLLWLIFEEHHPYLNDEDFRFLIQVLEACKLNMDDIALVNLHQTETGFEEMVAFFQPVNILASAIPLTYLPAPQEPYTIFTNQDYRIFLTGTLESMKADKALKSKLWVGLKQILGI